MLLPHRLLLKGLKSAVDPSRLRLLAVLALGEFTVSELTAILGQSQPRVSRHLKLLSDGGLLERFREQHWVFHRVVADAAGAEIVRSLLGLLDRDDPVVALDRERAMAALRQRAASTLDGRAPEAAVGAGSAQEIALEVASELGEGGHDALLYAGGAPTETLRVIGPKARRVLGLSEARNEVLRARAALHGNGLSHCVLQQGGLAGAGIAAGAFDVVVLDGVLSRTARRDELLREASRVLRPAGKVLIVEEYDTLTRESKDGNPLATVRDWVASGGLVCERLRPTDAGETHVLLATATPDRVGHAA